MIYQKVFLDQEDPQVYLEVYAADPVGCFVRGAILVIPGGGYGNCCAEREGEPVAQAFMPYGFNAFVLHYSNASNSDKVFPAQLIEASMAMQHIRENAEYYNIDPHRVFVCGFSAGGHLAACLGTMWHLPQVSTKFLNDINKPDGMVLVYPVISTEFHSFSFHNLLGSKAPTARQLEMCSVERHVDHRSIPAFVVHTFNDDVVDVRNALVLANAYKMADRVMELHIYPDAPHGSALGNAITACGKAKWDNPAIAGWVELAACWMRSLPLGRQCAFF